MKLRAVLLDLHAVCDQDLVKRVERPLGEPPFHMKDRVKTKCAHDRKQEPKCRAAFLTI